MIRAVLALLLAVFALAGCQAAPSSAQPATSLPASAAAAAVPACTKDLPPEAREVVEDVEAGGPYEYPRNDGVTFGNREGLLPDEAPGYYREFTVRTPGASNRGARRIVTGGPDERDPEHWYYTDDHYESFCEFTPQP
ncbi:ribonuclease domain-containing protein [Pseudonocardia cypriaca]|uniref:Guanyl-specific ribonuclease Sa n=1 Tax=Pseudonocardia cypriaca TaxID=882449 RepID=A0A543GB92_9PSEU|nr:ribonuclease domain-containing protein [Pseudonocardia cypriaca]TQM43356.1 guanyl-specific ribonuclease Sa [Pseudonocardia cypriaca]